MIAEGEAPGARGEPARPLNGFYAPTDLLRGNVIRMRESMLVRGPAICLAVLVHVVVAGGQGGVDRPQPGPEARRLGYFVGTWDSEGEAVLSEFGPAGAVAGSSTCDWFAGGFQVVCRGERRGPSGPYTDLAVLAYDAERNVYTYFYINSLGESSTSRGTLAADTWTWEWEVRVAGKPTTLRMTLVQRSPMAYTYKLEGTYPGAPWFPVEAGKDTKRRAIRP
jgi:hypothetical protein